MFANATRSRLKAGRGCKLIRWTPYTWIRVSLGRRMPAVRQASIRGLASPYSAHGFEVRMIECR